MSLGKLYWGSVLITLTIGTINKIVRSKEENIKNKEEANEMLEQLRVIVPGLANILENSNSFLMYLLTCMIPVLNLGLLYLAVKEVIDTFRGCDVK